MLKHINGDLHNLTTQVLIADGPKVDKYAVHMYGPLVCGRATMEEVRTHHGQAGS